MFYSWCWICIGIDSFFHYSFSFSNVCCCCCCFVCLFSLRVINIITSSFAFCSECYLLILLMLLLPRFNHWRCQRFVSVVRCYTVEIVRMNTLD